MDPRFPAIPLELEPDHEHVLVSSDGTLREHFNMIYSADDAERIRLGYCCINCGESQVDHGAPFPEACWVCGYQMRDKQAQRYAQEFRGTIRIGPSSTLEEELALMEELKAKQRRESLISRPSIVVPRSF